MSIFQIFKKYELQGDEVSEELSESLHDESLNSSMWPTIFSYDISSFTFHHLALQIK